MLTMLENWNGTVEVDGTEYTPDKLSTLAYFNDNPTFRVILRPKHKPAVQTVVKTEYRITVKKYMTKPATPEFDFMARWNNDIPMPLRTMVGTVEKETRGMVYMKLRGDIYAERIHVCMKCGRTLTNKVSQYFGIGPECGGHNYVNPFGSDQELRDAVESYRKQLQEITWTGWVVKSAIIEEVEV